MAETKKYILNCKKCEDVFEAVSIHKKLCYYCLHPKLRYYPKGWTQIRRNVLARDKVCTVCGCSKRLHIHHKDGNVRNNTMANLVTKCRQCHLSQHRNTGILANIRHGMFGTRLIYKDKLSVTETLCSMMLSAKQIFLRWRYGL